MLLVSWWFDIMVSEFRTCFMWCMPVLFQVRTVPMHVSPRPTPTPPQVTYFSCYFSWNISRAHDRECRGREIPCPLHESMKTSLLTVETQPSELTLYFNDSRFSFFFKKSSETGTSIMKNSSRHCFITLSACLDDFNVPNIDVSLIYIPF